MLIDSQQLESGDKLSDDFRRVAAAQIERFRWKRQERSGNREEADNITEQELLREVMNTVGKEGRLGESIRCVVSVSMLTEGWDTNTVTHVLGVRAFGTQLLCEQVVGRALRRQPYDLNEENRFNMEYADLLGIPFDFTARPVVVGPGKPRQTVHVRASQGVVPEVLVADRHPLAEGDAKGEGAGAVVSAGKVLQLRRHGDGCHRFRCRAGYGLRVTRVVGEAHPQSWKKWPEDAPQTG